MFDFNELANAARDNQGLTSYRQLAARIPVSPGALHPLLHGYGHPSDETVIRLAELADRDPQDVLLELHILKAKTEPAKAVWAQIKRSLTRAAALSLVATIALPYIGNSAPAKASRMESMGASSVYYVKYKIGSEGAWAFVAGSI